jgi:hypothetical protein
MTQAEIVLHKTKDPTRVTYVGLTEAYDWFNAWLFAGELPRALITMQRRKGSYGYFAPKRFGTRDEVEIVDEIALNPTAFRIRTDEETLSTLVHEQTHCWQQHFGKPSRGGYHNKEWAKKMKAVGLQPDNGNGRETGQGVSHHIVPGGPFAIACAELLKDGAKIDYVDLWSERPVTRNTRTKYSCPVCGANAWGKPDLRIDCRDCNQPMDRDEQQVATDIVLHNTNHGRPRRKRKPQAEARP